MSPAVQYAPCTYGSNGSDGLRVSRDIDPPGPRAVRGQDSGLCGEPGSSQPLSVAREPSKDEGFLQDQDVEAGTAGRVTGCWAGVTVDSWTGGAGLEGLHGAEGRKPAEGPSGAEEGQRDGARRRSGLTGRAGGWYAAGPHKGPS